MTTAQTTRSVVAVSKTNSSSVASVPLQKRQALGKALATLCLMKRQAEFNTPTADCWLKVLGAFPVDVVTDAAVTLGLSVDPFPDLGKLVAECVRALGLGAE